MIVNNLKHLKITSLEQYEGLPINASPSMPAYTTVLEKARRELISIIACYTRVVLVRMDLHYGVGNPLSMEMTKFCRSFTRKLQVKFRSQVAYQWVRESGTSEHNRGVHWHLWVALKNLDDIQPHTQAKQVQAIILATWIQLAGGKNDRNNSSGWFYLQRQKMSVEKRMEEQRAIAEGGSRVLINMEMIRSRKNNGNVVLGGVIDECFYAISYLAKIYTKVRTEASRGLRVFGSSSINFAASACRTEQIIAHKTDLEHSLSHRLSPMRLLAEQI